MTAIMPGKHASKLVILLVIAALLDTIQAFDVWSYWREKNGEKARIWKEEAIGTYSKPGCAVFNVLAHVSYFAPFR